MSKKCKHCGYPITLRNPSGICDHLYYPEYCPTCKAAHTKPGEKTIEDCVALAELKWPGFKGLHGGILITGKNHKVEYYVEILKPMIAGGYQKVFRSHSAEDLFAKIKDSTWWVPKVPRAVTKKVS